eukprot:CAMPEP_0119512194 /NCGR_PEP_ID=MMETSP1344-20130328/30636_1 /TAXON_ID=236787 /ORGANISM="Florenciella parvula, Strain CCMP2471" /LENGTH=178 /DNA_ID=CAMNT_0007549287 /DNA_START=235 /DNA_END=768 /DNA_ORIENTATION=-
MALILVALYPRSCDSEIRSCTNRCIEGTEDCCEVLNANLWITCYTMERISYFDGDQKNYGNFLEDPDLEDNEFIGFNSAGDLVATVGKGTYTGSVKLYDGGTGVFKMTLLNATLSGYERESVEYDGYDFTVDMSYYYYKPTCMKFGPDGLMYVCDDIQHRLVRYNVSSGTAVFHSHSD